MGNRSLHAESQPGPVSPADTVTFFRKIAALWPFQGIRRMSLPSLINVTPVIALPLKEAFITATVFVIPWEMRLVSFRHFATAQSPAA